MWSPGRSARGLSASCFLGDLHPGFNQHSDSPFNRYYKMTNLTKNILIISMILAMAACTSARTYTSPTTPDYPMQVSASWR